MAAEIKEELGVEVELVEGSGGIFEVSVDGQVVARKDFSGFPAPQEVVDLVAQKLGR